MVEGGGHLEAGPATGPEAAFLAQLRDDHVQIGPRPLRTDRDQPRALTVRVASPVAPPRGVPALPVWCNLLDEHGALVEGVGDDWRARHRHSPTLRVTAPRPGRYTAKVYVNAGRPGARTLVREFRVYAAAEETVARDDAARLAKGGRAETGSYRDLLAAALAAEALTARDDAASRARAAALLETVAAKLDAIEPAVHRAGKQFGMGRNVMTVRFEAAREGVHAWLVELRNDMPVAAALKVRLVQAAETEIKLGLGERTDTRELRGVDDATWTTTKLVAAGEAAMVLVPVALQSAAAVASGEVSATTVYLWAGRHPFLALALSEFVVSHAVAIGEAGGLRPYLRSYTDADSTTDRLMLFLQILMDLGNVYQASQSDRAGPVPEIEGPDRPGPVPAPRMPKEREVPAPRMPKEGELAAPVVPRGGARPAGVEPEGDSAPETGPAPKGAGVDGDESTPAPRRSSEDEREGVATPAGARVPVASGEEAPRPVVATAMRKAGMARAAVERVLEIAKDLEVRISFRPTNPRAAELRAQGAEPKPETIKANTVNELDVRLGMPKEHLGKVAHWNGWRLPSDIDAVEARDPALAQQIRDRYASRLRDYAAQAAKMEQLQAGGKIKIEDGVVYNAKSGNVYTGDYDLYAITELDGTPIPEGTPRYEQVAGELEKPEVGIQHGPLRDWKVTTPEDVARKAALIEGHETRQDIVTFGPDDDFRVGGQRQP